MPSTKLSDLHPHLQSLAAMFLARCKERGLIIQVTCTYRSPAEQNSLFAQGRTKKGPIVTKARGGQSEHNFEIDGKPAAKAFDIVPLNEKKQMIWNTSDPAWKMIREIWNEGFGYTDKEGQEWYLDWLGRPNTPFLDMPHFSLKKEK